MLLFMSGARHSSAPWYSQGVRQALWALHKNTSGVVFKVGAWSISDLRSATFWCAQPKPRYAAREDEQTE